MKGRGGEGRVKANAQVERAEAAEQEKRCKGEEKRRKGRARERKRGRLTPGSGDFGIAHSQFTANSFKLYLFPNIHPILRAAPFRPLPYVFIYGVCRIPCSSFRAISRR